MEIKFNAKDIIEPLGMANAIIGSKNQIPILSCIHIQPSVDGVGRPFLYLTGSDSETWITSIAYVEELVDVDSKPFCINANDLMKSMSSVSDKHVVAKFDEESNNVTFDYGNGKFVIPFESGESYPTGEAVRDCKSRKVLNAGRLQDSIKKVSFCDANDIIRPVMNGIHFDFKENGMVTVAIDHSKMGWYIDDSVKNDGNENVKFTLPQKQAIVLMNLLSMVEPSTDILLEFGVYCAVFKCKNFKIVTRMIETPYPKYESVIPKKTPMEVMVNRKDLITAIKRITPCGNENSRLVTVSLTDEMMTLSVESLDFSKSAMEEVPCYYQGNEFKIGFKSSSMLTALQNLTTEDVCIGLTDATHCGVLFESGDSGRDEYVIVLMPMLIM